MGTTATDAKLEEAVDKVEVKSNEAKASDKKSDSKPTQSATKAAEKKTETKKVEEKKVEQKPEEKKAVEAKPEKKEVDSKEEKVVSDNNDSDKKNYPYDVVVKRPIRTFRGPSVELLNKPFGGKLTVLESVGDFYKVRFVRAGFGSVTAYVLCEEVIRCTS